MRPSFRHQIRIATFAFLALTATFAFAQKEPEPPCQPPRDIPTHTGGGASEMFCPPPLFPTNLLPQLLGADGFEIPDNDVYFGKTTIVQGSGYAQPLGSRIGLHGGWQDPINARIYFRKRIYDPDMGRFLSRDPVGVWGDVLGLGNAYAFVGNAPTIFTDPTGLGFWSRVRNFAAGVADGAISAVTLGLVDSPVVGNLVGADTSSTEYGAGNVTGNIAASIATGIVTGGASNVVRGAMIAYHAADTALTVLNRTEDIVNAVRSGDIKEMASVGAGIAIDIAGDKALGKLGERIGKHFNCFLAGTLVATIDGPKPIETICLGDQVLARNERTGEQMHREVVHLFRGMTTEVVTLRIAPVGHASNPPKAQLLLRQHQAGRSEHHSVGTTTADSDGDDPDPSIQTIRCTPGHPFWVSDLIPNGAGRSTTTSTGRWVLAGDLRPNDHLLSADGSFQVVVSHSIHRESVSHYNIEVETFHTYFVSGTATATAPFILVHNDSRGTTGSTNIGGNGDAAEGGGDGKIYRVEGDKTASGKPYVGRTTQSSPEARGSRDGRDRTGAEVVDRYDAGDTAAGRRAEQQAINREGGVNNLDNKRNEIHPDKWRENGVDPPQGGP